MKTITLPEEEAKALLATGNGDAALLYLCRKLGRDSGESGLPPDRRDSSLALLRQMGLWPEQEPQFVQPAEPPQYTEEEVRRQLTQPKSAFSVLVGETQRRFGRVLNTEELKILLGITNYLGLSGEVVSLLISYCIERSRSRGTGRMPSFRTVEKEAYRWADEGIDTMEAAAAYMQSQAERRSYVGRACQVMGIDGRRLSAGEEKLLGEWFTMGFDTEAIQLAYERTCLNTGGLKWRYMHSILTSWHKQGLHRVEEIRCYDQPGTAKRKPSATGGYQRQGEPISPMMRQAVAQLLKEEKK